MTELAQLLLVQSGVVSRRQALECGLRPHDIRRLLRRREWALVHPGVYVDHTGPLNWLQRAWAATLSVAPAALSHGSAIRAVNGRGRPGEEQHPIEVAVDRQRHPTPPPGVRLHRISDLDAKVLWNASPPRVRIEHAVLDKAAHAADDFAAIETMSAAVQARLTTPGKLQITLAARERIARRDFLTDVLGDLATGACSVLEHDYLNRVERPHGLPAAERQVRGSARGPIYRDVDYDRYRLIVELDGRLFHDTTAARDRDLDRDLDTALEEKLTVRLGWGQVFGRPCETAPRIGRLLQLRGWSGVPVPCPECTVRPIRAAG